MTAVPGSAFGFRYAHENPFSMDYACGICSRCDGDADLDSMIVCEGGCKRIFHMDCIGLSSLPAGAASKWACTRCVQRLRSCHICDQVDEGPSSSGLLVKCQVPYCGKTFHRTCLMTKYSSRVMVGENGKIICPLHACATAGCSLPIDDESYFCTKCLTAYHLHCMPEETEIMCENVCLCTNHHFGVPKGLGRNMDHITDRIKAVVLGGRESGPPRKSKKSKKGNEDQVDESDFTGTTTTPSGSPSASAVDLVGLAHLPASLDEQDVLPFIATNIQFPFFVSSDVSDEIWRNDDKPTKFSRKNADAPVDDSGLNYIKLRVNEWTCPRPKNQFEDEDDIIALCHCEGNFCNDSCTNRLCMMQCTVDTCKPTFAAKKQGLDVRHYQCGNKYFGIKRVEKSKFKVSGAGGKGMGLKASSQIRSGEYLIEYIGEVMTVDDWSERQKGDAQKHFYTMGLGPDHLVDASRKGNESRLINHSCDPNLETQKWTVNGEFRIGLFAIRDIEQGEELTFNYKFETFASKPFKCLCGTAKCTGWIGGKASAVSMAVPAVVKRGGKKNALVASTVDSLPLTVLSNLSSPDIPIAVVRSDGTRKKEAEIQQEEIAVCNEKIDYFLQFIWAPNGVSGEDWVEGGRQCSSCDLSRFSSFNPGPVLALSTTRIEDQFIHERNLLVLRNLHKARRDFARKFYVGLSRSIAVDKIMETNWISDDICLRCRREGNLVWCKTCIRSFHQCCLGSGDSMSRADQSSGEQTLTCRRCKRLGRQGLEPPIRLNFSDRYAAFKARRNGYWHDVVLPSLLAGKHVVQKPSK